MRRTYTMLFITAALFVCSHGVCALEWDLPLDIDLIKVHFNHNIDSTVSDGITIQKKVDSDLTVITAPEYYPAASKYDECAYLMSVTEPTVKAEFYAYDLWQGYSNVSVITDSTDVWRLSESTMTFQPSGASGPVSFNTNANYQQAGSVGKYPFTWSWMVTKIDGDPVTPSLIGKSGHVMYNVLDTPNAPMTVPWVEVLDYACVWAQGETTATGAATDVTYGIHNNLGDTNHDLTYDTGTEYSMGDDNDEFDLSKFFTNIISRDDIYINCSDSANLFAIFSCALGVEAQTKKRWTFYYYVTYPVDVIGISYPTWKTYPFGMHQFGWFNERVYDPCLRVYQTSPILPCDMYQNTYEDYLSSYDFDYTGGPYTPTVY